jgi:hypothetical protein
MPTIHCCKDCIPPKRHTACHDTCEEYKKEKAELEAKKKWIKETAHPKLSSYDFDKISYADCKRNRHKG